MLQNRIWLSFSAVISVGALLAVSMVFMGGNLGNSLAINMEQRLPQSEIISNFQNSVVRHERVLYACFLNNDVGSVIESMNREQNTLRIQMAELAATSIYQTHYQDVENQLLEIFSLGQQLGQAMQEEIIDQELGQSILSEITSRGHVLEESSMAMQNALRAELAGQTIKDQSSVRHMVWMVVGFSLLLFASFVFVAIYLRRYLQEAGVNQRLFAFPEKNPLPVLAVSISGELIYCNPAVYKMAEVVFGNSNDHRKLLSDEFLTQINQLLDNFNKNQSENNTHWTEFKNDRYLNFQMSYLSEYERLHLYIEDITEQVIAKQKLEYQAFHDPLTGLANRRQMEKDLQVEGNYFALLNVDGFDVVSTTKGQQVVDRLFLEFVERIQSELADDEGANLKLYRYDGDLLSICFALTNQSEVESWLYRLVDLFKAPLVIDENEYYLKCRAGFVHIDHDTSPDDIVSKAITALHQGGVKGQSVTAYNPNMTFEIEKRLSLEAGLRRALIRQEFQLFYQPQISQKESIGKLSGAEALVRWFPDGEPMVSPGDFIPVAEESGLIVPIGDWILNEACHYWAQLQSNGLAKGGVISVNLSPRQFHSKQVIARIKNALNTSGLSPEYLELEITESLVMEDLDRSIDIMHQIKALGVRLAIDDFGIGYSSLSYLSRFPLDKLKIDREFILDIPGNSDQESLVQAIMTMSHALHLKVTVEGVENPKQLDWLNNQGADLIQGFYFSRPLPDQDFQKYCQQIESNGHDH